VEFADSQQAQEAIRQFNNQPFKGRPLAVNEARAKEAGPRPPGGGFRPPFSGPRPSGPPMRSPAPDFGDPNAADRDRPARKNFGPDAKPARNRAQRFKTEGGKKALKEKFTGQIFGPEDEDDVKDDVEIDDFSTGVEEEDSEKKE